MVEAKLTIKKWIKTLIEQNGKRCKDINIIFCSDPYLLEINKQFLGHDYYTDIITFDYCEGKNISGELYISVDTVKANAVEYEQSFDTELQKIDNYRRSYILLVTDSEDIVNIHPLLITFQISLMHEQHFSKSNFLVWEWWQPRDLSQGISETLAFSSSLDHVCYNCLLLIFYVYINHHIKK